jgi:hypothetical protein
MACCTETPSYPACSLMPGLMDVLSALCSVTVSANGQVAQEYAQAGRAPVIEDRLYLPNGQTISNDGTRHGVQMGSGSWLETRNQGVAATTQVSFARKAPHIFSTGQAEEDSDKEDPLFQVFGAESRT